MPASPLPERVIMDLGNQSKFLCQDYKERTNEITSSGFGGANHERNRDWR
jgi:hypothetical protein